MSAIRTTTRWQYIVANHNIALVYCQIPYYLGEILKSPKKGSIINVGVS